MQQASSLSAMSPLIPIEPTTFPFFSIKTPPATGATRPSEMVLRAAWEVCAEAEDGIQAVAQAKQWKPDLILLHLAMPEMNGFEAARQISSVLPGTPILLNTLYASPQVEKEAEKVGVLGVISKSEQYRLIPAIEEAFAAHQK